MYVCICNALTDRQIVRAIQQGIEDPTEIYASLGCQPQCGRCMPMVHELVREHRPAAREERVAVFAVAAE